jgi:hypothetical protein
LCPDADIPIWKLESMLEVIEMLGPGEYVADKTQGLLLEMVFVSDAENRLG